MTDVEWEIWLRSLKIGDYAKLQGRTVRIVNVPRRRLGIVVLLNGQEVIVPSINLEPPSPLEMLGAVGE